MFENISLQPPEHVWSQHVMELLDLVLFGNVCKLLQKSFQIAAERKTRGEKKTPELGESTSVDVLFVFARRSHLLRPHLELLT